MPPISRPPGAVRRAATYLLRSIGRAARIVFLLALVAIPVPLANLVVVILRPWRRNLPAEVLRKK